MPYIILWPVKEFIKIVKKEYQLCQLFPTFLGKKLFISCHQFYAKSFTVKKKKRKRKKPEKERNIRCFPLASVESIILCINNLPFPKGYDLRNIKDETQMPQEVRSKFPQFD